MFGSTSEARPRLSGSNRGRLIKLTPLLSNPRYKRVTIGVMADKLIGSLIYGEHEIPKKSRTWKEALKVPVSIALVLIFIGGLAYKFANFREERCVRQFVETVASGQYDTAYQSWDADGRYTMKDFLQDWGKDGYYTKGMREARVADSNGKGGAVVVYVTIDTLKYPVALRVDKETLKISFSPVSKYPSP